MKLPVMRGKGIGGKVLQSVPTVLRGGFEAASMGRRFKAWWPGLKGVNRELQYQGSTLRSRSRDLIRNNPHAEAAIEALVDDIVGTGIRPLPDVGQVKNEQTARFKADLLRLWNRWTQVACTDGTLDFYGLQGLAVRGVVENGETFVRQRTRRASDGLVVPLQLQILEADFLDMMDTVVIPGGKVVAGVAFDLLGRRAGYRFYQEHPGEDIANTKKLAVRASEVAHVFMPKRAGQVRGQPWLAGVMARLKELDAYDDAELVAKKIQAMMAAYITSERDDIGSTIGAPEGSTDSSGSQNIKMEPGTVATLPPGTDIKFTPAPGVNGNYKDFTGYNLRSISSGMGVPYHKMTGDLTDVNYSSIRAGEIAYRRRCQRLQKALVVKPLCQPVWHWFLDAVLASGVLVVPKDVDMEAVRWDTVWMPQEWAWVDPQKEAAAVKLNMELGLTSQTAEISKMGRDPQQVKQEIAEDCQEAHRMGLPLCWLHEPNIDGAKTLRSEKEASNGDSDAK